MIQNGPLLIAYKCLTKFQNHSIDGVSWEN